MKIFTIALFACLLLSCNVEDCPDGLNLLPEYGHIKKCALQIIIDNNFINGTKKYFKNKTEASQYYTQRGWDYFNKGYFDTAMKRFNQGWLLDSMNADVYWGFGNILGKQKKYRESIDYFNRSIQLNPDNAVVWYCAALSLGQIHFNTKSKPILDSCIDYLQHAIVLKSNFADAYREMTVCYVYKQKDSARKYMAITEKLDSKLIEPDLRAAVMGE